MTATELLSPLAAGAGVGMSLSPLLQIRRMLLTHSAADVSLAAQGVIAVGAATLGCYGLALDSAPLIATYATGTCASFACFAVGLQLRWETRAQRGPDQLPGTSSAPAGARAE